MFKECNIHVLPAMIAKVNNLGFDDSNYTVYTELEASEANKGWFSFSPVHAYVSLVDKAETEDCFSMPKVNDWVYVPELNIVRRVQEWENGSSSTIRLSTVYDRTFDFKELEKIIATTDDRVRYKIMGSDDTTTYIRPSREWLLNFMMNPETSYWVKWYDDFYSIKQDRPEYSLFTKNIVLINKRKS